MSHHDRSASADAHVISLEKGTNGRGSTGTATLLSPELMRFALVIGGGLVVDLTVGSIIVNVAGLSLTVGSAAGLLTGAVFNYILHELWTFRPRQGGNGLSTKRASLYLMTSLIGLCVRLGLVTAMYTLATSHLANLAVLVAAAGASFVVNYLLSRLVVFRRAGIKSSLGE
ncbi:GtrA family protein [Nitrospirillum amazonense]|uniref:GtrA family protein n=1 Tax=Nitrospirillum amazonense TaxID=28077 RepID=UPI00241296C0|nr:GtrA family protein [Nitrospirillum amazonense]MDG3438844.1 GtrA family protein [Nitrospirillum amazonense]